MKKLTLSVAFLALSMFANAQTTSEVTLNQGVEQTLTEVKLGTVIEVSERGGKISDNTTGDVIDFFGNGAQVIFKEGDVVSYIAIVTPNGKVIVKDIKKPN